MKHITLILTIIALLACTNHKAQNTNSESQDTIQSQWSTVNSQPTSVNNEKTDKNSPLIPHSSFLISKEILLGKFNPAQDTNFVLIPEHMASNKSMYCHRETFQAYLAMRDSALCEGITLTIVSATRNFDRQLQIWNRKWQNTQCPKHCPPELGGRAQRAEGVCNTDSLQLACDICKVRSIMRYSS
ncbi:MAG: D-alanyl-D-alanine carboxypeptidase family protein, partial [Paludibacteraceae bacterium]|nr:D-alanyl-D-alanine carboxypeptidase family protein [Paludibacteraceae bacterium]